VKSALEFLADPSNRALIGWIGGGLATVAGGLWVVLKYFLDRKMGKPPSPELKNDLSVSVGHGVGIGGNAQVRIRNLRVGFGLQTLFWIGLLLLLLSFFGGRAWDVFRSGTLRTPSFAMEFDCRPKDDGLIHQLGDEEAGRFDRFKDFSEANDGSIIYLSLLINKDCAACGCSRVESIDNKKRKSTASMKNTDPPANAPIIYIDSTPTTERKGMIADVERRGHEILTLIPDKWAKAAYFYVPDYFQIPENGVYRRGAYASMLAYDGPFVVHFEDGTGYQFIYFEPLNEPSPAIRSDVNCFRQRDRMSFVQRLAENCF
jgi:hypothetical protein